MFATHVIPVNIYIYDLIIKYVSLFYFIIWPERQNRNIRIVYTNKLV